MGNNWPFHQENLFCAKKTPQKPLLLCAWIWFTWLWKDLDAKPLTPGQLLGCPWKLWGTMLQTTGCLKKTELCQIKHLQNMLVIEEKYLWFLWQIQLYHALNRQFQCFYWALCRYSLVGIQGLERGTKEQEVAQKLMVSQHNSNWNQSHYSRLDWFSGSTGFVTKNHKYFFPITSRICKCFIW